MPAPKTDPQRDNLYYLEAEINGWWRHSCAPTSAMESLLMLVCKYYNVETPRFRVANSVKIAHAGEYDPEREEIVLNRRRDGCNAMVLCHELAHYLVDCFYADAQDHGPEFCAIYMHLLDEFCLLPHRCFRLMAKTHRLRIGRRYRPQAFNHLEWSRPPK
jgi:hypothetical protein